MTLKGILTIYNRQVDTLINPKVLVLWPLNICVKAVLVSQSKHNYTYALKFIYST